MVPELPSTSFQADFLMLLEIGCAKIASDILLWCPFISVMYHGIISNTLAAAREATLLLIFATLQNGYWISVHCFSMLQQPSLA